MALPLNARPAKKGIVGQLWISSENRVWVCCRQLFLASLYHADAVKCDTSSELSQTRTRARPAATQIGEFRTTYDTWYHGLSAIVRYRYAGPQARDARFVRFAAFPGRSGGYLRKGLPPKRSHEAFIDFENSHRGTSLDNWAARIILHAVMVGSRRAFPIAAYDFPTARSWSALATRGSRALRRPFPFFV